MTNPISDMGFGQIMGLLAMMVAVAFGNAAGVGGAGIIMPVLLIVFSFELLEASALSNFMLFTAFILRFWSNLKARHPTKDRPLIDYDTAAIMLPASLLGTKLGVIIHDVFPKPVLLIALTVTLSYLSYRTLLQGLSRARKGQAKASFMPLIEKEEKGTELKCEVEPGAATSARSDRLEEIMREESKIIPTRKTAMIVALFGLLVITMFVEGGKGVASVFGVQLCSGEYWMSIIIFGGACVGLTYLIGKNNIVLAIEKHEIGYKFESDDIIWNWAKIVEYCIYGMLAGILSATFGIGGGMLLAPLFAELGMLPEVVTSTSSLFVLITTGASSVILMSQGYWDVSYGILTVIVSLCASFLSIYLIAGIVKALGKPWIVLYILSAVIFISGIAITSVGFYNSYVEYGTLFAEKEWIFHNFCRRA